MGGCVGGWVGAWVGGWVGGWGGALQTASCHHTTVVHVLCTTQLV